MERGSPWSNYCIDRQQLQKRETIGLGISNLASSSPEFVLQWGNKKRLRCMKIQPKAERTSGPALRTNTRVDRRVIRTDIGSTEKDRSARNFEDMKGGHGNNGVTKNVKTHRQEGKRATSAMTNHHQGRNDAGGGWFEMGHEQEGDKKVGGGGGGSSSGSEVIPSAVWPPKFVIALTNKEKEEDFMAIKGSKLPQRPRKRSKYVQRNLKLVSPGGWLCDLTLDRYEVKEKKTSKKKPRGLKAMCNSVESDSE